MNRALITGSSGFCGRHLGRYLSDNQFEVYGTRLSPSEPVAEGCLESFVVDICDPQQTDVLIKKLKPDLVFHLAALSIPEASWNAIHATYDVNLGGTINLLRSLRRFSKNSRFLFVSSSQVYGRNSNKETPLRETDAIWPVTPYGMSKALGEFTGLDFFQHHGVPVFIARAFNHLGRGQSDHFIFSDWCHQVAVLESKGEKGKLSTGSLDVCREFLHVEDVVRAYSMILTKGKPGEIYNVATGNAVELRQYANYLVKQSKVEIAIVESAQKIRKFDPLKIAGDSSKLSKLGWAASRTAFDGIDDLLHEWREKTKLSMKAK